MFRYSFSSKIDKFCRGINNFSLHSINSVNIEINTAIYIKNGSIPKTLPL